MKFDEMFCFFVDEEYDFHLTAKSKACNNNLKIN